MRKVTEKKTTKVNVRTGETTEQEMIARVMTPQLKKTTAEIRNERMTEARAGMVMTEMRAEITRTVEHAETTMAQAKELAAMRREAQEVAIQPVGREVAPTQLQAECAAVVLTLVPRKLHRVVV